MNLSKQLTTVTTLSKLIVGILFITLPFVGFWLGMEYQKIRTSDNIVLPVSTPYPTSPLPTDSPPPTILDPEKVKYCQSLDQKECYESTDCIIGSGPSCPICMDIRYQGCQYNQFKQSSITACQQTGGNWNSKFDVSHGLSNATCVCPSGTKQAGGELGKFGCITDRKLCEITQGSFEEKGELFSSNCSCPTGYTPYNDLGCFKNPN